MRRLVELLIELLIHVLPREAEEKLNGIMVKLNGGNKQGKKQIMQGNDDNLIISHEQLEHQSEYVSRNPMHKRPCCI